MTKETEIISRNNVDYAGLLSAVTDLLEKARQSAAKSINSILTTTYWEVGKHVIESEQKGLTHAIYGAKLLKQLGVDLTTRFGRGFSWRNLYLMRSFYLSYPKILQTPSAKLLSWSHYVQLLSVSDVHKRGFYEEEAKRANWSVKQLERQIDSMLYERIALSKKKGELLQKSEQSGVITTAEETIKDPYVLEFLGLPEMVSEKDLESALIKHLADFLLELGYGFTFISRQKRLQIGTESYYIDLLFYHRGLKCLVAIDLKIGKFTHADAGQMNLYLNYLQENEKMEGENDPIGLVLCTKKDETVAHYALGGIANKIFASRYQLQLPDPELLRKEIESERMLLENQLDKSRSIKRSPKRPKKSTNCNYKDN